MMRERVYLSEENSDLIAFQLYNHGSTNRPERERMKRILTRAIKHGLTERQRVCVTMYYLEGKRMKNIAGELGLSKSTVSRHIKAATFKLRRIASFYDR